MAQAAITRGFGTLGFPSAHHQAVGASEPGSLDVMRWVLMQLCAKDSKVGFSNIIAKAAGIEAKPAFRQPFRGRCLVPVDNSYE